jgi:cell division septal protein FtsQ
MHKALVSIPSSVERKGEGREGRKNEGREEGREKEKEEREGRKEASKQPLLNQRSQRFVPIFLLRVLYFGLPHVDLLFILSYFFSGVK